MQCKNFIDFIDDWFRELWIKFVIFDPPCRLEAVYAFLPEGDKNALLRRTIFQYESLIVSSLEGWKIRRKNLHDRIIQEFPEGLGEGLFQYCRKCVALVFPFRILGQFQLILDYFIIFMSKKNPALVLERRDFKLGWTIFLPFMFRN